MGKIDEIVDDQATQQSDQMVHVTTLQSLID